MHQYNQLMGGVDRNDRLAKYSAFNHRSCKWWKKGFFHILNLCMVNAFVLNEWCKRVCKQKIKQLLFYRKIIKQIITQTNVDIPCASAITSAPRLIEQHFPSFHQVRRDVLHMLVRFVGLLSGKWRNALGLAKEEGLVMSQVMNVQSAMYHCVAPCFKMYHIHILIIRMLMLFGNVDDILSMDSGPLLCTSLKTMRMRLLFSLFLSFFFSFFLFI